MLKLAVCGGGEGRAVLCVHGRGMCTFCNVVMFNMMLREQCQTSFHEGVLSWYRADASVVSENFLFKFT